MSIKRRFGRRSATSPPRESVKSMDCFGIPAQRTMFGVKHSEHWDLFQSRYSDTKNSTTNIHSTTTKRDREKVAAEQRGKKRWGIRNPLWIILKCLFVRSQHTSRPSNSPDYYDHGDEEFDDEEWMKTIPFLERYSGYFERRKTNHI